MYFDFLKRIYKREYRKYLAAKWNVAITENEQRRINGKLTLNLFQTGNGKYIIKSAM